MRVLVAYVPVIHEGYLQFFREQAPSVDAAYVVSSEMVKEHTFLEREIRAIDPVVVCSIIEKLGIFRSVKLLDASSAASLNEPGCEVVIADEQITKRIAAAYFPQAALIPKAVFLRWDEANVLSGKAPTDVRATDDPFDVAMMNRGVEQSNQSSDWWRHVGAVIVKDGKVLLESFNTHVPSVHTPYANGDPRDVVPAGTNSEIATTMHAEQRLITEAARKGISLQDAVLYTTVFPCPMCAKQVAYSGMKACYYASGHASLDGESIMRANGVELVFVKMPECPVA